MSAIVIYARKKGDITNSRPPMFLLPVLLCLFSSTSGELISFRGLTGNKPSVSNATILTSFFTSRDQGWTEELNFRCEQRKDDYAVNIMAKGKFSRDCLIDSPLGVVPQMMGKLSSCYCEFNLTICDKQLEVKKCVMTGPGRRNTHGSEYFYHIGFRIQHIIEFTGWAYRVELECFAIRSSHLCKRLATNITKSSAYRTEWELVAVIFGMAASYVVACIVMFYSWLCNKRSKRLMQNRITSAIDHRRQNENMQFVRFYPSAGMIEQPFMRAPIHSFPINQRIFANRETEKRLSTYV